MKRYLIAALVGAVSFSPLAYAQTSAPGPSTGTTSSPATSGTAARNQVNYYRQASEDYRVSRLVGTHVRNNQNETIGEVEDLIIDRKGEIKAAIISVGGFLGIGERWVAVNYDSLNMQQDGANWRVMLNTTKDQMKMAPEFKYESSWAARRTEPGTSTGTTPMRPATPVNPGAAPGSPTNR